MNDRGLVFFNSEPVTSQIIGADQYVLDINNPFAIAFLEIRYSKSCAISLLIDIVTETSENLVFTEQHYTFGSFGN